MPARFVNIDRQTPMLLPPDLRDWVPADDLVHFVIASVEGFDLRGFVVNERGTGDAQFPPAMMLALLIYCYANGVFSSRRIEKATYRDVAVRSLCADRHPDHDTICEFRRRNFEAVADCFLKVLLLAKELRLLKVGTISLDGTRLDASASKHRNVTYARAGELVTQLEGEIRELLTKAESADRAGEADPRSLPPELARRERLRDQLQAARERLEAQARARAASERAEYEAKCAAREQREGKRKGPKPKPPSAEPRPDEQTNLSDPESRLRRKSKNAVWQQGYNAQAAVDADGSALILAAPLVNNAADQGQLQPGVEAVSAEVGEVKAVLADSGYGDGAQVEALQARGIEAYVSVQAEAAQLARTHDFRPAHRRSERPVAEPKAPWRVAMKAKLSTDEGRARYRKRWSTVEPVFGVIKAAMGFRQFRLRGLENVRGEWQLVCLAYNFRRLWKLKTQAERGPSAAARRPWARWRGLSGRPGRLRIAPSRRWPAARRFCRLTRRSSPATPANSDKLLGRRRGSGLRRPENDKPPARGGRHRQSAAASPRPRTGPAPH